MDGDRQLQMHRIAVEITELVNEFVEDPIMICYGRPSREIAESAGMRRFTLVAGDEYFFIERGASTLYVVNVTADSYLTAVMELMDLIGRKF